MKLAMSLGFCLLMICAETTAGAAPGESARVADVLGEIEIRYRQGRLGEAERQLYRVAAIKQPGRLPADLRNPAPGGNASGQPNATRVLHDAWRYVVTHEVYGSELHNLLLPPPDLTYVLDSATLPLRVSYNAPAHASLAQAVLTAAEHSWVVLIQQYGFSEPPIEDGAQRYRIYVEDAQGAGGYTAPYDEVWTTPRTDCYTYIVIDQSNDEFSVAGTVAHELNHATQAAMDCVEPVSIWENTATYIMGQVYPDELYFTIGVMPYFQSQPWRALDYMNPNASDYYEYGGALFMWYLADTFAPTDGPVFAAEIWQNSIQNDWVNEPDYYDGIEAAVAARGGSETMEDIVIDFAESRFFVGSNDDGAHIAGASNFWDAEVALTEHHQTLPVQSAIPPAAREPAPFGANHVLFDLPPGGAPLTVRFDGDDDTRWAARVVLLGGGATDSRALELGPATGDGSLVVEPGGHTGLLLVVANLGNGSYDPDDANWPTSSYTYTVEQALPPPVITGLSPGTVEPGQAGVQLRLQGENFREGTAFGLAFDATDLEITALGSVTGTTVDFTIAVSPTAVPGPRSLVLTNGDGTQATGVDLLTVVDPTAGPDAGAGNNNNGNASGGGGGCGCRAGGTSGSGLPIVLLLLVGLGVYWRRRRRE